MFDSMFVHEVLDIFSFDNCDEIWWRTDEEYAPVTFFISCNDTFGYACADAETLTPEDIPLLRKSMEECNIGYFGSMLFCARKRNRQPLAEIMERCLNAEERVYFEALPKNR